MKRRILLTLLTSLAILPSAQAQWPLAETKNYLVVNQYSHLSFARADQAGLQIQKKRLTLEQAQDLKDQGAQLEEVQVLKLAPLQVRELPPSTSHDEWGYRAIRSRDANKLPDGEGQGVTVCVVDSGVDATHKDLQGAIRGGVNLTSPDRTDYADAMGHGTMVSGIIAARGELNGVAPKSQIYAVKVFDDNGGSTNELVAKGILECLGKASVINLSLGGEVDSIAIQAAIFQAKAQGVTVIAAAGNEGKGLSYPARDPNVIAVGAMGSHGMISQFSSYGKELKFLAPGEDIEVLTTANTYMLASGTSMSAAFVSGTKALALSRQKTTLRATDLGLPFQFQGEGLINAFLTAL